MQNTCLWLRHLSWRLRASIQSITLKPTTPRYANFVSEPADCGGKWFIRTLYNLFALKENCFISAYAKFINNFPLISIEDLIEEHRENLNIKENGKFCWFLMQIFNSGKIRGEVEYKGHRIHLSRTLPPMSTCETAISWFCLLVDVAFLCKIQGTFVIYGVDFVEWKEGQKEIITMLNIRRIFTR